MSSVFKISYRGPKVLKNCMNVFVFFWQGIHESGVPSSEYHRLESLVEIVVSPYICNVLHNRNSHQLGQSTDH